MKFALLVGIFSPFAVMSEVYKAELKPKEDIPNMSSMVFESIPDITESNEVKSKEVATEVSEDELINNPQLLKRAMESVLLNQNINHIKLILPIYQQLSDADKMLINYGRALIAHGNGNYNQAIDSYRTVLSDNPELSVVRLNLAMAMYRDRQFDSALAQFKKLQGENLPEIVATSIKEGISAIKRQEDWQFYASGYYQQDDNINGAPNDSKVVSGNDLWILPKPESAHGVHINLGVSKRINLSENFYAALRFSTDSDIYWDNHDFDSINFRTAVGMGVQNADLIVEVSPFYKKRFFGGVSYSKTLGAKFSLSYQVAPKWLLSQINEISSEYFDPREHLNGGRQFNSLSATYTASPTQWWSAGVNYFNNQARDAEDNYNVKGISLGWGQEWGRGVSSNVTLSANKRQHGGVDFFNIQRQDEQYRANVALWNRDWHWMGLTPRLVMSWDKTHSNHFYYNNKKDKDIRVEFSKQF